MKYLSILFLLIMLHSASFANKPESMLDPYMIQSLRLTRHQIKKITALKAGHSESIENLKNQAVQSKEKLEKALYEAKPDLTAITNYKTELNTSNAKRVDEYVNYILGIKKILSNPQYSKWIKMKAKEDMSKEDERFKPQPLKDLSY